MVISSVLGTLIRYIDLMLYMERSLFKVWNINLFPWEILTKEFCHISVPFLYHVFSVSSNNLIAALFLFTAVAISAAPAAWEPTDSKPVESAGTVNMNPAALVLRESAAPTPVESAEIINVNAAASVLRASSSQSRSKCWNCEYESSFLSNHQIK